MTDQVPADLYVPVNRLQEGVLWDVLLSCPEILLKGPDPWYISLWQCINYRNTWDCINTGKGAFLWKIFRSTMIFRHVPAEKYT